MDFTTDWLGFLLVSESWNLRTYVYTTDKLVSLDEITLDVSIKIVQFIFTDE